MHIWAELTGLNRPFKKTKRKEKEDVKLNGGQDGEGLKGSWREEYIEPKYTVYKHEILNKIYIFKICFIFVFRDRVSL